MGEKKGAGRRIVDALGTENGRRERRDRDSRREDIAAGRERDKHRKPLFDDKKPSRGQRVELGSGRDHRQAKRDTCTCGRVFGHARGCPAK